MRKMITCSFDDNGVIMTAWNGIHPDRNGHFSITKAISRMDFNEACQDRKIFGLILGVDITQGWQNPLNDAIKNASPLKIDPKKTVDFLVQLLVAKYGEEKATQIFEAAEKENNDIEAYLKAQLEKEDEPETGSENVQEQPESGLENVQTETEEERQRITLELEPLFEELSKLDPSYERTGFETVEEVKQMIADKKAETTETKEEDNDGQGRTETATETGSKKSRRKNDTGTPVEASTDSVQ